MWTWNWTGEAKTTTKKSRTIAQRPKPQRTCVGCRTVQAKREMVRVVRTAEGTVSPDPTGKAPGRGAYICARAACWEAGLKGRLAHSLEVTISQSNAEDLREYARDLGLVEVAG